MEGMFSSLICFYLFFLYISFGTFFGQGIAPASHRGVKQCNQNMESDILRQHSLALSPWPSKAFKLHIGEPRTREWWTPRIKKTSQQKILKRKKQQKHLKLETDDFPMWYKKNVNTEINIEMKWTTTFWYQIQPLPHTALRTLSIPMRKKKIAIHWEIFNFPRT